MDRRTANHQQMLAFAGAPTIAFLCECGDAGCHQTVPLAPRAYHDLRINDEPLLHPGHTPVEDTPVAAAKEREGSDDPQVRAVAETLKLHNESLPAARLTAQLRLWQTPR
jgi:hypothetical protein